ncbi:unnamed protein product [Prorocentrum cordatum]|uniref:Ion transport domain-containing protein n=2 Tax=Prorocentrum cordatum TaxID=2364126 RepID=A0ABN9QJE6_9DINO|nr:unnamed protein product [Polarella glacialis]
MCEENANLLGDGNTPCQETCDRDRGSPHCQACLKECQARCECEEFCSDGLIKDAALCVEQGAVWQEALSQNFNDIFNAMLTLFEISTTEGWVDVMYSAVDSNGYFMQPARDNQVLWAFFFVLYIFVFFMFFINLSVGVIVDKFMDLKAEASTTLAEDLPSGADAISVTSQAGFSTDVEITIECADQGLSETRKIKTLTGVGRFQLSAKLDHAFPKGATVTKKGKAIMSTDGQDKWKKKWLQARKSLDGRGEKIYLLTNLQNLPTNRRKVYDMITSRWFENAIMAFIILNTALMCLKWFPEPTDNWQSTLDDINYFFAAVFTVEAAVKLFALRLDYFRSPSSQWGADVKQRRTWSEMRIKQLRAPPLRRACGWLILSLFHICENYAEGDPANFHGIEIGEPDAENHQDDSSYHINCYLDSLTFCTPFYESSEHPTFLDYDSNTMAGLTGTATSVASKIPVHHVIPEGAEIEGAAVDGLGSLSTSTATRAIGKLIYLTALGTVQMAHFRILGSIIFRVSDNGREDCSAAQTISYRMTTNGLDDINYDF